MTMGEWYYNLNTHQVESYHGGRQDDRLGPYATREEAERAMERFQQRQESWDTDPVFNDPEPEVDPEEPQEHQRLDGTYREDNQRFDGSFVEDEPKA